MYSKLYMILLFNFTYFQFLQYSTYCSSKTYITVKLHLTLSEDISSDQYIAIHVCRLSYEMHQET